jgi:FkbM family methyltransferase
VLDDTRRMEGAPMPVRSSPLDEQPLPRTRPTLAWHARVLSRRFISLYHLAETPREVLSVAAFLLQYIRYALNPRRPMRGEATILLQGMKFTVGLRTGEAFHLQEIYLEKAYEKIADFVPKPGWIVFDLGANIGLFSLRQASRGARVYAFEPNADCYGRLVNSVADNRLNDRVTALNCALGAEVGRGMLVLDGKPTPCGKVLLDGATQSGAGSEVQITSLDHMVSVLRVTHIDLLKIDTEGAEVDVLRGVATTLRSVDRLVIEYHSQEYCEQVCSLLRERGFDVVRRDPDPSLGLLYAKRSEQPTHVVH